MMQAGKYLARVDLQPDRMSSDGKGLMAILRWNEGSGRNDGLVSLGEVLDDEIDSDDAPLCYRNKGASMCLSQFKRCK
jgi:hypothetical protein